MIFSTVIRLTDACRIANIVDPDQTALQEQSDLGLHCLLGPTCPKSLNFYVINTGFSLTPYLESFTPTFGLGTPVFPRISSNLHCGTPTFSKRCLWDSYFQNPSENPATNKFIKYGNVNYCLFSQFKPDCWPKDHWVKVRRAP